MLRKSNDGAFTKLPLSGGSATKKADGNGDKDMSGPEFHSHEAEKQQRNAGTCCTCDWRSLPRHRSLDGQALR